MKHLGSVFRNRLGDPATWTGDWSEPSSESGDRFRTGNYLAGDKQAKVHARIQALEPMMIGMAIRGHRSGFIAAVMCVSRETVDRRLRPLGMKNIHGKLGRPRKLRLARELQPRNIASPIVISLTDELRRQL